MRLADVLERPLRQARALVSRRSLASLLPSGDPIFLHRPHGQPYHGITREVIRDFDRLSRLVIANRKTLRYAIPADTTFVTYNNCPRKSLIERCYEAYGITGQVVLGKEVTQWDWSAKVRLVLEYLESGRCTTRYLVATDAADVLMVNDPTPLLERFRSYSCDVLFCNTFVDWPPNRQCRDFETLKYYSCPFHCHLSAGAFIGEQKTLASYLSTLFEAYQKQESWAYYNGAFDDQLGWRSLHLREYPRIQVDAECRVFKRYDLFRNVAE